MRNRRTNHKSTPRVILGRCSSIQLESESDSTAGPKWVQVAKSGTYLGYNEGRQPFVLERRTFEEVIANLHAHPSYVAGPDGVGTVGVIPWDFNHASEMSPVQTTLAAGSAHGWTLDMEIRQGADGTDELWALTEFVPEARELIRTGRIKWASVALTLSAVDAVTAMPVGAICTSIALTNRPFIEGMQQLVASKGAAQTVAASRHSIHGPASSYEDAVEMLRECLGLSETEGTAAVIAELMTVLRYIRTGAPEGVEVEEIVESVRTILAIPPLVPDDPAIANAIAQLQSAMEESMADTGAAAGAATATQPMMATRTEGTEMELLKALASKLGVKAADESVLAEVEELVSLRDGVVKTLDLSRDRASVVLTAVASADEARAKLSSLFEALGVSDVEAGVAKIEASIKAAAKLEEVLPELKIFKEASEKAEAELAEKEVEETIAACRYPAAFKGMLLSRRQEIGSAAFLAEHAGARQPGAPVPAHITASAATAPGGGEYHVSADGKVSLNRPGATPAPASHQGAEDIDHFPGDNAVQKCLSFLASKTSNWSQLDYDSQMTMALNLKRSGKVVCAGIR